MKTKYIKCSCGSELLSLEKFDDDQYVYFSIWERGFNDNNKLTFFERLRWCWKILKSGRPFTDSIVFDGEGMDDIVEAIKDLKNDKKLN